MADDLTDYSGPLAMAGSADDESALSLVPMSAPLRAMFERGQKMANVDFSEADRRREEAIANKRAAIQRGYQNLLSSKPDNIELLLSISKGLLSPTRTGSFGESLGNVAGEALPALQRQRQMERNRQDQLAQYDVSMSSVDAEASKDLYDKLLRRAQLGQQTMNRASTLSMQEDLQRDKMALTREMGLMRSDQAQANAATAAAARRELRDIELDEDEAKSFGLPRGGTYTVSVDKANPADMRIVGRAKPQTSGGSVQDIVLTEEQAGSLGVPPGPAKVRVDAQGNIVGVIGRPLTGEEKKGEQPKLPASLIKEQNEMLENIAIASGIKADLDVFSKQIDEKKLDFGAFKNWISRGRNLSSALSTEQTRNFAEFETALEKLRNDSLRLNKGVQTEGDAVRVWNEIMKNYTDPKFVKQRLETIKKLNDRAAMLHEMRINAMRAEMRLPPLDVSKFTGQAPIYGDTSGGSGGWTVREVR